jgi:hypothetical protein
MTTPVAMRRSLLAFNRAESAAGRPTLENGIGIFLCPCAVSAFRPGPFACFMLREVGG